MTSFIQLNQRQFHSDVQLIEWHLAFQSVMAFHILVMLHVYFLHNVWIIAGNKQGWYDRMISVNTIFELGMEERMLHNIWNKNNEIKWSCSCTSNYSCLNHIFVVCIYWIMNSTRLVTSLLSTGRIWEILKEILENLGIFYFCAGFYFWLQTFSCLLQFLASPRCHRLTD